VSFAVGAMTFSESNIQRLKVLFALKSGRTGNLARGNVYS